MASIFTLRLRIAETPSSMGARMNLKFTSLSPALYQYVVQQRTRSRDPVLESLRTETAALGDISRMQISPEQGSLFTLPVADGLMVCRKK